MEANQKTTVEIERKYIIKMPDFAVLRSQSDHTESEILQIYLPSKQGETRRIRRRTYNGNTVCTETRKVRIDSISSNETEREISINEFLMLSKNALNDRNHIIKTRHTFVLYNQLYEIDVYPQWCKTAIMETELESREIEAKIPSFIEIVREVTGNKAYSNAGMSKEFPKEDIIN